VGAPFWPVSFRFNQSLNHVPRILKVIKIDDSCKNKTYAEGKSMHSEALIVNEKMY